MEADGAATGLALANAPEAGAPTGDELSGAGTIEKSVAGPLGARPDPSAGNVAKDGAGATVRAACASGAFMKG